jgi:membrane protein
MNDFGMAGGGILSSGVATRALFALLPGLLLLVSLVGFLVKDPAAQQRLIDLIAQLVPPIQDLLESSLAALAAGAVGSSIVGLIALIWAASGFFQTLDVAFAVILREKRRRDPVLRGIIGLLAVIIVLGAVTVGVVASLILWGLADRFVAVAIDPRLARLVSPAVIAGILFLGLVLAYRFIPTRRPGWWDVLPPAAGVGIAIAVLTQIFSMLAPYLAGTASIYGAIAAIFVLLAWLQIASQLLILGMCWVRLRMDGMPPPSEIPWPMGTLRRPDFKGMPVLGGDPPAGGQPADGGGAASEAAGRTDPMSEER